MLTDNQQRLLTFAERFTSNGSWTHLGEDARPDALVLQEKGLVEVSPDETKYRLDRDHQELDITFPDVAVVTRDDTNETVAVLILKGGYNSIKAHKALKAKYDIPDNVYLNSRLIGTEEVPE